MKKIAFLFTFLIFQISNICFAQWTQIGPVGGQVSAIAGYGPFIFEGGGAGGVFISSNSGLNWTQSSLNIGNVRSLAVSSTGIYAGRNNYDGLLKSTDNGQNWFTTGLNGEAIYSLAASGSEIIAGYGSGLFRSTDDGISWVQAPYISGSVTSIAFTGSNIFAATFPSTLYRSPNRGSSGPCIQIT